MSIFSWLRPRAPRTDSLSRRQPAVRLELEPLEDRQLLSGGLDPAFAAAGQRTIPLPNSSTTEWASAVAVQKDGKIVLVGQADSSGSTPQFTVARLRVDGTLDTSFGTGGEVTFAFNGATDEHVASVAIDPSTQNILVAGTVTTTSGQTTDTAFAVARLKTNGSFDTSFHGSGQTTVEVGGQSTVNGQSPVTVSLGTVALGSSGHILLSGTVYTTSAFQTGSTEQFAVARLNTDGSVDSAFGTNGVATVAVNAGGTSAADTTAVMALPGDGSIVLAGTTGSAAGQDPANFFTVARLTAAGQLDTTFGTSGMTTFGFGTNPDSEVAAVAIQADGAIVVGGLTRPTTALDSNADFALARLLPIGQLDTSFNKTGQETLAFDLGGTNADRIAALAIQPDGKIVAVGSAVTATLSDTTTSGESVNSLAVQSDGTVLPVVSNSSTTTVRSGGALVTSSGFAVARFNPDGSLDSGYGTGGKTAFGFSLGAISDDRASAVALQADGNIVLAGRASLSNQLPDVDAIAVARVLGGDAAPDTIGVFDPATAIWYLSDHTGAGSPNIAPFAFGGKGWIPVVGDWTGDGHKTVGVFDPATATWYLKNDNTPGAPSITAFQYGEPGWIPVVGDWNGDGTDTIGVVDPKTETWYLRNSNSAGAPDIAPFQYGAPGWIPVAGDWNGDGTTTIGAVDSKTETWYLRNTNGAGAPDITPFQYGAPGSTPVVGDWNGDGTTTVGVVTNGVWYLRNSNNAGGADIGRFAFGAPDWIPVSGVWAIPQLPLKATAGASASPVTTTVSATDLSQIVTAALQRFSAAGASPTLLGNLATAKVTFAQLPGGQLGRVDAANNQIVLDSTAAGYGWFVDQTPAQDEEFTNGTTAAAGSPASGHIDLLSAVVIEMAQLAGLDLVSPGLRTLSLATGQRNVNTVLNVISSMNASPTEAPTAAATNAQQTTSSGQPTTTVDPNVVTGTLPLSATPPTTTVTPSAAGGFPTPLSNSATQTGLTTPLSNSATQAGFTTPLSGTSSQSQGFATPLSSTSSLTSTQPFNQTITGLGILSNG
jgi:uncharacterized delta-60 repeat protein